MSDIHLINILEAERKMTGCKKVTAYDLNFKNNGQVDISKIFRLANTLWI